MNKIVPFDEYGVIEKNGGPMASSRRVAEVFGKQHIHVLESIRKILEPANGLSIEFGLSNFRLSSYRNEQNKKQPEYLMTRDGFAMLAMGFTGKKAMKFKEAYIRRFNEMESFINNLAQAKMEFPAFTAAIMLAHEEPKHYHFSNEVNMINRIVLGMDAAQFKRERGIDPETPSIRPYLTPNQIKAIEMLQRVDIGLQLTTPDFQERKQLLTGFYLKAIGKSLLSA